MTCWFNGDLIRLPQLRSYVSFPEGYAIDCAVRDYDIDYEIDACVIVAVTIWPRSHLITA